MANKIVGTEGDDVLKGTKKKDIIIGKGGDDILVGKKGNDVLKGGKGNDILKGGKGNDDLKGKGGGDLLVGSKGADHMWGGNGADIFKFKSGDGSHPGFPGVPTGGVDDIVFDYFAGLDKFDVPDPLGIAGGTFDDPVGGLGTFIVYGTDAVTPTGSFFVSGGDPLLADFF